MQTALDRLAGAVGAFRHVRQAGGRVPSPVVDSVRDIGNLTEHLNPPEVEAALRDARALLDRGVDVVYAHEPSYPSRLLSLRKAPPILFYWGNSDLFDVPAVGMCGSRHASDSGLRAARACGRVVASLGLTIVSGYAKGVDTETHLAALETGGKTVIVLAEGISHFRQKRSFVATGLPEERVLVISQFAPSQSWNVGSAMARNAVIFGLAQVLIVIEAGETGGTLNAGLQALANNRPVLALDFKTVSTPPGNEILFGRGATRVRSLSELEESLNKLASAPREQLRML